MKQTKTLLVLILYFISSDIKPEYQASSIQTLHTTLPMITDQEIARKISLCRLVLFPTLLAIVAYVHKNIVTDIIYDTPLYFLPIAYLLGNYLIDTAAQCQKINKSLDFLFLFHTMNRYMLSIFAIKNNIEQQSKNQLQVFDEQQFFQKIAKYIGYTLEELEYVMSKLFHQNLCIINNLTLGNYQNQFDDRMYCLLKDKITLEQIMAVSKHDPILYSVLTKYQQNSEQEYEAILETIGSLIKEQINSFIKKTFTFYPEYDNNKTKYLKKIRR